MIEGERLHWRGYTYEIVERPSGRMAIRCFLCRTVSSDAANVVHRRCPRCGKHRIHRDTPAQDFTRERIRGPVAVTIKADPSRLEEAASRIATVGRTITSRVPMGAWRNRG